MSLQPCGQYVIISPHRISLFFDLLEILKELGVHWSWKPLCLLSYSPSLHFHSFCSWFLLLHLSPAQHKDSSSNKHFCEHWARNTKSASNTGFNKEHLAWLSIMWCDGREYKKKRYLLSSFMLQVGELLFTFEVQGDVSLAQWAKHCSNVVIKNKGETSEGLTATFPATTF